MGRFLGNQAEMNHLWNIKLSTEATATETIFFLNQLISHVLPSKYTQAFKNIFVYV